MQNIYLIQTELAVISTGLFITLITGAPVSGRESCQKDWTYGQFVTGSGCIRRIDDRFTEHTCLTSGYHIALLSIEDTKSFSPDKIICVTAESYDRIPASEMPTSPRTTLETKFDKQHLEHKKESLAKPFGCCVQGLSPSG